MTTEIEKIKSLRDSTGLSFNEIKKALNQANGDEEKAQELLKSLGATMADKKSGREVHEGIVEAYVHTNKKLGGMIELLCETDFVARNSEFQELARNIAMQVTAMKPETPEELLKQPFVKDPSLTVEELINQAIAKLGENIKLGGFVVFEL